ncbi:hypothetical protein Nepgr_017467 [Nepenthes gracilis]|uniref:Uncharacterized protein n=1 Tax=Nepenthes gracilis TaxID=150966 RepID=A0AAD3SS35_NEPGR|nr:hypothetical protein Nepgr_017467 [Nepenthes gracilis]
MSNGRDHTATKTWGSVKREALPPGRATPQSATSLKLKLAPQHHPVEARSEAVSIEKVQRICFHLWPKTNLQCKCRRNMPAYRSEQLMFQTAERSLKQPDPKPIGPSITI